MPIRELQGPFLLTAGEVASLPSSNGPGVYVLGSVMNGDFCVERVGKAMNDLPSHLEVFVGRYSSFKFRICDSPQEAYTLLCKLYHRYQPRDNLVHPKSVCSPPSRCPNCQAKKQRSATVAAGD